MIKYKQRTVKPIEVVRLSVVDQLFLAQALTLSQRLAPALQRAFARRHKLLRME